MELAFVAAVGGVGFEDVAVAGFDRKITAELAPKHDEKDGEELKQSDAQRVEVKDNQTQTANSKESMVAEPRLYYNSRPVFNGLR